MKKYIFIIFLFVTVLIACAPSNLSSAITITGVITNLNDAKEYLKDDSYLQIVLVPPDGILRGQTDEDGFMIYESELAKIPIPKEGVFTFIIDHLEPGIYAIVAQRFYGQSGAYPFLIQKDKLTTIEILKSTIFPVMINAGEVKFYIP